MIAAVSARRVAALSTLVLLVAPARAAQVGSPPISFDVTESAISADSTRVVYRADLQRDDVFELWSVPIAGGASRRLNPTPDPLGDVQEFRISQDSRSVVFRGDLEQNEVFELWSAPLVGRLPAARLNAALVAGGDVGRFEVSPESTRVVYLADQDAVARKELFVVPIHGGAVKRLNGPLVAGGTVQSFAITPDAKHVVYVASQESASRRDLYAVPIEGGVPRKLSGPLPAGAAGVYERFFVVSPDSRHVVYTAWHTDNGFSHLYSVPILGGAPVELPTDRIIEPQISPDSTSVVYHSVHGFGAVPIEGGAFRRLGPPLPGRVASFEISPDSRFVVYNWEQGDGGWGVFSVALRGGDVTTLEMAQPPAFNQILGGLITPDSSRVLYHVSGTVEDFFSIPISGGPETLLTTGMMPFGSVASDSSRFVYTTYTLSASELFSIPVAGGAPIRLSGPLVAGGNVEEYPVPEVSRDSTRVVYRADQDTNDVIELYSVPIAGGPVVKLTPTVPARRRD